jgi:hypothetical protein
MPLAVVITLVLALGAEAWESDVHYGLTYWLALQAGFTDDAARTVAEADLSLDRGIRAAPLAVGVYACRGDYGASRDVRNNHFPTNVDVPNSPERREVVPNSAPARKRAGDEAKRKIDSRYSNDQVESLRNFGEGLHPFQDSWSHQGQPDVPPLCSQDYTWAHPYNRGGWSSHIADLSHWWVEDILPMAKGTYDLMIEYLRTNTWASTGKTLAEAAHVEEQTLRLAVAETKTEKAQWFQMHGIKNIDFLNGISRPDGTSSFSNLVLQKVFAPPPESIAAAKVPQNARDFARTFLTEWMTAESLDDLLKRVDTKAMVDSIGLWQFGDDRVVSHTVLRAWRMRDHGLMAELGHASPEPINKALRAKLKKPVDEPKSLFRSLEKASQDPKRQIRYESLEKAIVPFGKEPFLIVPLDNGKFAVFVQFKHTPSDVVVLELSPARQEFTVTSLRWMIDH